VFKSTKALAVMVSLCISSHAGAQYDAREAVVIDLLHEPDGKPNAKRSCAVQIDDTNVPCNDAWYIQFNDGSRSIQFNKTTEPTPMLSLFGTETNSVDLSVDNVVLRLGNRATPEIELEAVGDCVLNNEEILCQARTSDDRRIVGHIFAP
jgi:hypothetical protein